MRCIIEKIERPEVHSIGAPKRIEVVVNDWAADGESGQIGRAHV